MSRIIENLRKDNKNFITFKELKEYSKDFYYDYKIHVKYLISRRIILKIFDNIYYVKNEGEIEDGKLHLSALEILAKGLKKKGINNWYYGLYTALELNNINYDHEEKFFYVINSKFSANKPIIVLDEQFRFLKFKNKLFNFGIINNDINYSNPEKTLLDLIYIWKYNQIHKQKIIIEILKLIKDMD